MSSELNAFSARSIEPNCADAVSGFSDDHGPVVNQSDIPFLKSR